MKVIYIASAGRSGSTLLDIVLGGKENCFSAGELTFLMDQGIENKEYCSCGKPVIDCEFWKPVWEQWKKDAFLSVEEYASILKTYLRNKGTFSTLRQIMCPSVAFRKALKDTRLLFDLIAKQSENEVIIDSSKNAQRILFLRKAGIPLEVVFLKRQLNEVIRSTQKVLKKDLAAGIERDFEPLHESYVRKIWWLDTYLPRLFAFGLKNHAVSYEALVNNPEAHLSWHVQQNQQYASILKNRGPFKPAHLCAGNRMRMSESISIKRNTK